MRNLNFIWLIGLRTIAVWRIGCSELEKIQPSIVRKIVVEIWDQERSSMEEGHRGEVWE